MNFTGFPKIARLSREIIITEKIDGTNAQVVIELEEIGTANGFPTIAKRDGLLIGAGSRTRWIKPGDDNYGFARWVEENATELVKLGPGSHFGEWWGSGVQRGYGLTKGEKRFSLFNTDRWGDAATRPACCSVVPTLYTGEFDTTAISQVLENLARGGSVASPGFMDPEGIVIFHTASGHLYKKTIKGDEKPKGSKE